MEGTCKTVAKKVGKAVEPIDDKGKIERAINEECRKEIKSIDKTVVKIFADQLKKKLVKKNKKIDGQAVIPGIDKRWMPNAPGSGVPSLTIPTTELVIDPTHDVKGKFSIKVWADPREFEKNDKGVMVNFTLVNW